MQTSPGCEQSTSAHVAAAPPLPPWPPDPDDDDVDVDVDVPVVSVQPTATTTASVKKFIRFHMFPPTCLPGDDALANAAIENHFVRVNAV